MEAFEKIDDIKYSLFPDIKCVLFKGLLYPFVSAFAYVTIGSLIENLFYKLWLWKSNVLRKTKQAMDSQRLLSRKESRELWIKIATLEDAANSRIESLESENSELKKIIADFKENNAAIENQESESESPHIDSVSVKDEVLEQTVNRGTLIIDGAKSNEINELMTNVILELGHNGKLTESTLRYNLDVPHAKLSHALDTLQENGIIEYKSGHYSLSKKGTKLVIDLNLI